MISVDNLLVSHSTLSPRQPRQTTYKKGLISNNMTWGYFLKSFHKINRSQNKDHNSNTQCLVLVQIIANLPLVYGSESKAQDCPWRRNPLGIYFPINTVCQKMYLIQGTL